MWKGSFVGCPGVAGVDCESVSVYDFFALSYAPLALTVGVPACVYHRSNCVRSLPFASAIAIRKSSHVTAWPSCRLKYKSMPLRKPALESNVSYMRITSQPFS